jgi:hypothetical protein
MEDVEKQHIINTLTKTIGKLVVKKALQKYWALMQPRSKQE